MRLLGVVVVVAAACGAVASGEKPRPNLILLLVDDLGHNDVGWANNRTVRVINSILHRSCDNVSDRCPLLRRALHCAALHTHSFHRFDISTDYTKPGPNGERGC